MWKQNASARHKSPKTVERSRSRSRSHVCIILPPHASRIWLYAATPYWKILQPNIDIQRIKGKAVYSAGLGAAPVLLLLLLCTASDGGDKRAGELQTRPGTCSVVRAPCPASSQQSPWFTRSVTGLESGPSARCPAAPRRCSGSEIPGLVFHSRAAHVAWTSRAHVSSVVVVAVVVVLVGVFGTCAEDVHLVSFH
ncbi:hypothetical protein PoB_003510500 [Plakobranchus ocellatus]|uniref:Uncharacterized protein n=1 Tax=Plakobranchus ocellatus TaxID=259542 RepID=A0AAV4AMM2_9GAST|nr:hypothetical protein PoB_003510500 [Plakobranchus ocellatus]